MNLLIFSIIFIFSHTYSFVVARKEQVQKNPFEWYVYKTFLPYAYSSHTQTKLHTEKLLCINSFQCKTLFYLSYKLWGNWWKYFHKLKNDKNALGAPSVPSIWKFPVNFHLNWKEELFRPIQYFSVCGCAYIGYC